MKINRNKKIKVFFARSASSLMLPILIMAVAGLFIGIGNIIETQTTQTQIGVFLKNLGDPIFKAMPILFLIGVVFAFTEESGLAVLSGIVGYLIFNALQIPFIEITNNGLNNSATILGIHTSDDVGIKIYQTIGFNLGMPSLNTSIFGGVLIGSITAFSYNKFSGLKLPKNWSFFSGKKLAAIANIILVIPFVFIFLLAWPWLGVALAYFSQYLSQVIMLDSFIFGVVENSLMPFGLHHAFAYPLLYDSFGADLIGEFEAWSANGGLITQLNDSDFLAAYNTEILEGFKDQLLNIKGWDQSQIQAIQNVTTANELEILVNGFFTSLTDPNIIGQIYGIDGLVGYREIETMNNLFIAIIEGGGSYLGDLNGWNNINETGIVNITYQINQGDSQTLAIFDFMQEELDLNYGRFMQGKYPISQFALPAASAAMIVATPKTNRNEALLFFIPASITAFLTGITQPLEFTFLFLAPILFWGFHSLMIGLSFLFMNLLNAHMGVINGHGGLLDSLFLGIIPASKGIDFYWSYIIGVVFAIIYFFTFLWWTKRFNLSSPGREVCALFIKKSNFVEFMKQQRQRSKLNPQGRLIVKALGGWDNISKYGHCSLSLRYKIKDKLKVSQRELNNVDAFDVIWKEYTIQIIIGQAAESLDRNIRSNIGTPLNLPKDMYFNREPDLIQEPERASFNIENKVQKHLEETSSKDLNRIEEAKTNNKVNESKPVEQVSEPKPVNRVREPEPVDDDDLPIDKVSDPRPINNTDDIEIIDNINEIHNVDNIIQPEEFEDDDFDDIVEDQIQIIKRAKKTNSFLIRAVASGRAITLENLKDDTFGKKKMGDGLVIRFNPNNKKGYVYAPIDGQVIWVASNNSAYEIRHKNGIRLLVQVGVGTDQLDGKAFTPFVEPGDEVKAGRKIAEVDITLVRAQVEISDVIVIVKSKHKIKSRMQGRVTLSGPMFSVQKL